jgi:Trichohyalin-plectin-homology domain
LAEKQRREEEDVRKRRLLFADDVRHQIHEKEQVRINERQKYFQEGIKLDEEARRRQQKLEEVKQKKLQELRLVTVLNLLACAHTQLGYEYRLL